MKHFLFGCIALFSLQHLIVITKTNDPLAIVIMVKDEENFIVPTLQPYVDAGIHSFLVFDTGSTDKTIQNTINFFEQNNISNWHIKEEPFIDFAASRNRALDLAEECFPEIPFVLMPDAEWYLHNVESLITFCYQEAQNKKKYPHSYLITIAAPNISFDTQRLIKQSSGIRFGGVVHETLVYATDAHVPQDIYFTLGLSRQGAEKSQKRYKRDVQLLQNEFDKNPKATRTTFYLAQTYECLDDLENAYKYYKIRTELPGWDEENFMAMYRLAQVTERLIDRNPEYTWPMALDYYMRAYTLRPTRVEPLVRIARYYLRTLRNPYAAYIFAQRAAQAAYPSKDILFIEKPMYVHERFLLLAKSAWQNGAYETGIWATEKYLEAFPSNIQMKLLQEEYQRKLANITTS